jgi:phosphohistidine phosphatase
LDLILWRHAEAEDSAPDDARRLTPKGIRQAERMAAWLKPHLPADCRILVSPAQRAQQTAAALQRKFETPEAIAPGAGVAAVLKAARWPVAREAVVVVGHQPTLGAVAAKLLGGEEAFWSVKKGAVWWLSDRDRDGTTRVVLRVAISPDFV